MTLQVKFSHPHFPDGQLVGIYPFGQIPNGGEAVDITEEAEQQFVDEVGLGVEEAYANDAVTTVTGSATAVVAEPEPEPTPTPTPTPEPEPTPTQVTPDFLQGGEK